MPKFKKNPNAMGSPMYKMKGTPMQRNFKDWWKDSKIKKDLKVAGDIIRKDVATIEGRLTKVGSKFKKDVEGLPGKLGIKKQSKSKLGVVKTAKLKKKN